MAKTAAERQAEKNRAATDLAEFAEMLVAALELPAVRRTVCRVVATETARTARRNPLPVSVTQVRDMKAARVRGRGLRG